MFWLYNGKEIDWLDQMFRNDGYLGIYVGDLDSYLALVGEGDPCRIKEVSRVWVEQFNCVR